MKCLSPYVDSKGNQFNCGRCHACRVNITSQWTLRCLYELSDYVDLGASFITLTYDDEHLPKNFGLQPDDLTKFWKRLRKNFGSYGVKIKYRACGEYGDKEKKYIGSNGVALGRPHYHAIVYGLDDVNDLHRQILADSWKLCDPYLFDKNRGRDSAMQPVCREDIAYVCGYIQKKLNGSVADSIYGDRCPPFSRSSQGLGLNFALSDQEFKRITTLGYTTLNGQKIAIPRYLREKLNINQGDFLRTPSLEKIQKRNDLMFQQFEEYLKSLQLDWMLKDWTKNCNHIERRFYAWREKLEDQNLRIVEENFYTARYLRGKGKF